VQVDFKSAACGSSNASCLHPVIEGKQFISYSVKPLEHESHVLTSEQEAQLTILH
jgi:hypothetical protein